MEVHQCQIEFNYVESLCYHVVVMLRLLKHTYIHILPKTTLNMLIRRLQSKYLWHMFHIVCDFGHDRWFVNFPPYDEWSISWLLRLQIKTCNITCMGSFNVQLSLIISIIDMIWIILYISWIWILFWLRSPRCEGLKCNCLNLICLTCRDI